MTRLLQFEDQQRWSIVSLQNDVQTFQQGIQGSNIIVQAFKDKFNHYLENNPNLSIRLDELKLEVELIREKQVPSLDKILNKTINEEAQESRSADASLKDFVEA